MVAASDCCLAGALRSPPASRCIRSSSCGSPSASSRPAASSIARGMPSSRVTSKSTSAAVSPDTAKDGSACRARSANSWTAGDCGSWPAGPDEGSGSGLSRYLVSPAMPRGSRLVASTVTSSAADSTDPHSFAVASRTCSQLSSTSRSCRRDSATASACVSEESGDCATPRAAATAAGTSAGSCTAASSTSHAPSANRAAARRVLTKQPVQLPRVASTANETAQRSCKTVHAADRLNRDFRPHNREPYARGRTGHHIPAPGRAATRRARPGYTKPARIDGNALAIGPATLRLRRPTEDGR